MESGLRTLTGTHPSLRTHSPGIIAAWFAMLCLSVLAMFFAYGWSEKYGFNRLDDIAMRQLELYSGALESEIGKYDYLPGLLELDEDVRALLTTPHTVTLQPLDQRASANRKLASLNVRAGSAAIFVMNVLGIVVASSDSYRPDSILGQNFSGRAYFADAISGEQARFFAANPANATSEYFVAQPLRLEGRIIGVAVVAISLDPIEATWIELAFRAGTEKLLVLDENDVVILSSVPAWKYKSLTPLSSEQRAMLARLGKYPDSALDPLDIVTEFGSSARTQIIRMPVTENGKALRFAAQDRLMPRSGWRLRILSDAGDVWRDARYAALGTGALTAFLCLLSLYLWQRQRAIRQQLAARRALQRAHDHLELKVEQRTRELSDANRDLIGEIAERKRAEAVLREAQEELLQAGKLAVLGQLSAGISHEISQPLTALRALSENAKLLLQRGRVEDAGKNLASITELTERMGRITAQLKSFARKSQVSRGPVVLGSAISNVQVLLENRINAEKVQVLIEVPDNLRVECDGNRLEQVLVNLFANALDAMKTVADKRIHIQAQILGERVSIRVSDSGPGIPDSALPRLFEPFFTTKPQGEGLGLGLVISSNIVREFGGALRAFNLESGGAAFEFDLTRSSVHEPA